MRQFGTLIIGAICKNGLVLAADSRLSREFKGEVVAYFEGNLKIFEHKGVLLAMAGDYIFDSRLFSELFNKFVDTHPSRPNLHTFFDTFSSFMRNELSAEAFQSFVNNQFLVGGYHNEKPEIHYHSDNSKKVLQSGYQTNYPSGNDHEDSVNFFKRHKVLPAARFIQNRFGEIIRQLPKKGIFNVGGPASIVLLTKNGTSWLAKQNKNAYSSHLDFAKDFVSGKIEVMVNDEALYWEMQDEYRRTYQL